MTRTRWLVALALAWWLTWIIDRPDWKASALEGPFATRASCDTSAREILRRYPDATIECREGPDAR